MIPRTALALLLIAAATPALAQPVEQIPGSRPERQDAAPPAEQLFISPSGEPFRAPLGQAYPVGAWFGRADADRDGALVPAEFAADHITFFERLDADRSGVVDAFESNEYERTIAPEVTAESPPPRRARSLFGGRGRGGRDGLRGAAVYGLINEPLPVRAADADFDFKITRQEALAAADRRFGLLDVDKDGRLAWAELPTTRAQARLR